MNNFELTAPLFLYKGDAVTSIDSTEKFENGDPVSLAETYSNNGLDGILVFDRSNGDAEHDQALGIMKKIAGMIDIPMYGGGNIKRVEDVKKLIYAGCRKVFLNYKKESSVEMTKEVSERFGKEKILACVATMEELESAMDQKEWLGGVLLFGKDVAGSCPENMFDEVILFSANEEESCYTGMYTGICNFDLQSVTYPVMEKKHELKARGLQINTYQSTLSWADMKLNNDGMLPVVVQDYKTLDVLMVAYMNQEAFETTIRTGKMTYWSRSRNELWMKGLTSGHFQYVKELDIDCDNDTLLAKVKQIGAACHTGNRSCFYRPIMKKEYDSTNPQKVFEDVFAVIEDRKVNPKEGSYTNYLFDKGIDKILKKVGEEAAEIIIAAKNPDPQEVVYELSDFFYHAMVLMAERGISWEDVTKELARR